MRKVYTASSLAEAHMVAHALGQHDVPAQVQGEADPLERATVWVERDGDHDRARSVLATLEAANGPPEGPAPAPPRRRRNVVVPVLAVLLAVSLYFNLSRDRTAGAPASWDTNGDGRDDTWAEYDGDRLVSQSFDTNFDGRKDDWTFHGASGAPERHEVDLDHDGRVDGWERFEGGAVVRGEYDNDGDGKPDEWTSYQSSRPVERAWSFRNDGVIDKKAFYRNGRKVREQYDRDRDGTFDETLEYDAFERVVGR